MPMKVLPLCKERLVPETSRNQMISVYVGRAEGICTNTGESLRLEVDQRFVAAAVANAVDELKL